MHNKEQSRRDFMSMLAIGTAGAMGASSILAGCTSAGAARSLAASESGLSLREQAPEGELLKAGIIGCGGRGTGAAVNFVDAGPNLQVVALGDVFQDQLDRSRAALKESRGIEVEDEKCFTGFDAYEKVIDSDIDVVICATPPHFRPMQVATAIDAGKHVFQEKPVAVDPAGARQMAKVAQKAKQNNLCMVSGTVRRYQKDYVETQRRVANGEIGDVVSATIVRNGGALWWVERKPEWSDMEYMLRNWGNFTWLSGDHIVEQFIHEIDVMSWHVGSHPIRAIGYGGRQRRRSGDQYDQFSIVYEYENGVRCHCSARQIDGCDNGRKETIAGTKGYADASGTIYRHGGEAVWEYPHPREGDPDTTWRVNNPYVQEHVELVTAIRTGGYINDSEEQIKSTRMAVMGRMAAYTGREITWEEVLDSDMRLGPESHEFGPVEGIAEEPPVVGSAPQPTARYG